VSRPHGSPYDQEERLYGPPPGTYDPEWVTRMALDRRPRMAWDRTYRLATSVWRHLWASPQLSADELGAYVALDEPAAADEEVACVVDCAFDFCAAFEVEPPRLLPAPVDHDGAGPV